MSEIFVSYKKEDRAVAERLVAALRAAGKDLWWDDALTPHEAWDAMIERQIAAARVVLVLWSPRSVHSDWVRSEAHYAQDHHKMVPVLVESCSIPLAFMLRQAVDLTDGKFDESNPNWSKLLAWIDAVHTGDVDAIPDVVPAETAAIAAVPVKVATGDRWLGPASRPRLIAVAVGIFAIAALVLFAFRGALGFGQGAHPDVYVDPIKVAVGPDMQSDFAQVVNDELSAQLNAASRITPLDSDGQRHANAYQMSGNIRTGEGKFILFAKIFAPGIAAPVISPRIEVPLEERATAAKQLATTAAGMLRCTATASDSSGSQITVLPEKAIRPWAQYCQMNYSDNYNSATTQGYLKAVVAAAPDFANGWANLAEELITNIFDKPLEADRYRAEVREAYGKALDLDPDNQKGLILKALDRVGLLGRDGAKSLFVPLDNFAEFEKLALLANNVRPSDCGCEAIIYGGTLAEFGQLDESLTYVRKVIANDPSNMFAQWYLAVTLAALGRDYEASQALDAAQTSWPDSKRLINASVVLALSQRDWAKALEIVSKQKEFPGKAELVPLLEAAKAGNAAGVAASAKNMSASISKLDSIPAIPAMTLSLTGHEAELVPQFVRLTERNGVDALKVAWLPGMQAFRARPEFIQAAKRANLYAYWRQPNHLPDACKEGSQEPFCKLI